MAGHGRSKVEPDNVTTAAEIGLRRDEIHDARRLRDAERDEAARSDRSCVGRDNAPANAAGNEHVVKPDNLAAANEPKPRDATKKYARSVTAAGVEHGHVILHDSRSLRQAPENLWDRIEQPIFTKETRQKVGLEEVIVWHLQFAGPKPEITILQAAALISPRRQSILHPLAPLPTRHRPRPQRPMKPP